MSSRSHAARGRRAAHVVVVLLAASTLFSHPLIAQAEIGFTALTEYGFGAVARVGASGFHLEGGAGFVPVWVLIDVIGGDDIFRVYFPTAIGGKASFRVGGTAAAQIDVEVGATYNALLRLGFGGGASFRPHGSRLLLSVGAMIYPDAKEQLRLQINEDEGTNFTPDNFEAPLTAFQPYAGIAIFFGRP